MREEIVETMAIVIRRRRRRRRRHRRYRRYHPAALPVALLQIRDHPDLRHLKI
jgi:hypothetical protein